ncbi:MAG TPA: hypothetical protein VF079_09680 [Sphingomicrobium sp.]
MRPHDVDYYRARAAAERRLAEASENANVAAIHEELALQYEALVECVELRPTRHIAASG